MSLCDVDAHERSERWVTILFLFLCCVGLCVSHPTHPFPHSLRLIHYPPHPTHLIDDFVAPRELRVKNVGYPDQPAQLSLELVKYYAACVIAG